MAATGGWADGKQNHEVNGKCRTIKAAAGRPAGSRKILIWRMKEAGSESIKMFDAIRSAAVRSFPQNQMTNCPSFKRNNLMAIKCRAWPLSKLEHRCLDWINQLTGMSGWKR